MFSFHTSVTSSLLVCPLHCLLHSVTVCARLEKVQFPSHWREGSLRKTTSFNACRKSFFANVHKTGFNSGGRKPRNTNRRSIDTGTGENGDDSMCASSTIKKNGSQQPTTENHHCDH